jgi:hypothetical protein
MVERRCQRTRNAHPGLGRGAQQHLVGQHLEPREISDPLHERDVVDWLGQKVVGPRLEPLHPVSRLIERRDDDHRYVLRAQLGFDAAAGLEAIHTRHHHIEQHDIHALAQADLQRLPRAPRRARLEILGGEARLEQLPIGVDVVDHEDTAVMRRYRASPMNCRTVSRNIDTEIGLEM